MDRRCRVAPSAAVVARSSEDVTCKACLKLKEEAKQEEARREAQLDEFSAREAADKAAEAAGCTKHPDAQIVLGECTECAMEVCHGREEETESVKAAAVN